jgi:hypothetical protein
MCVSGIRIPVVVVSARGLDGNKDRALKAGARAFVQKPWNNNELLAIIGQLLGQPDSSMSQPKLDQCLCSPADRGCIAAPRRSPRTIRHHLCFLAHLDARLPDRVCGTLAAPGFALHSCSCPQPGAGVQQVAGAFVADVEVFSQEGWAWRPF